MLDTARWCYTCCREAFTPANMTNRGAECPGARTRYAHALSYFKDSGYAERTDPTAPERGTTARSELGVTQPFSRLPLRHSYGALVRSHQ